MPNNILITLSTQSQYIMGNKININVNITNLQNESVNLYKPVTSIGFMRYNLFAVTKDFEVKPYHGAVFFSSREENIMTIKSQENFSFNVSIAKHYLIDESGRYSLELKQYKLFVDDFNQTHENNSKVYFDLYIEDSPPVVTYAGVSNKLAAFNLKCQNFGNNHCIYNAFTAQQINDTKQAHYYAEGTLTYLVNNLRDPLAKSFENAYAAVFCKSHYADLHSIMNTYKLMNIYIQHGIKYWFNGKKCDPGAFGYVIPGSKSKDIYLCSMYERADIKPNAINIIDTKVGFIIHEISHQAAQTEDHFYSYQNCTEEAFICNQQTTTNADCIEFFAEIASLQKDLYSGDEL